VPNPPLRVPWPFLDALEPAGAGEMGLPTGFRDPDAYQGKIAGQSLPHADPEGIDADAPEPETYPY